MGINTFSGSHKEIGIQYGKALKEKISDNVNNIILHPRIKPYFTERYKERVRKQVKMLSDNWSWLLEEMEGVSIGAGVEYEDIVYLNYRGWYGSGSGYNIFSEVEPEPDTSCSQMVVTLVDGSLAHTAALDDLASMYCGPIKIVPDEGYRLITFPFSGTSIGDDGMNSEGLSVSISSQSAGDMGMDIYDSLLSQDIAIRIILQTCKTSDDVRNFCKEHYFVYNLTSIDANGDIFCAHQTYFGPHEIPVHDGCVSLTNHIYDDGLIYKYSKRGIHNVTDHETSRRRNGRLVEFLKENNKKRTLEQVMDFFAEPDANDPGRTNHVGTAYITMANPQKNRNMYYIMEPENKGKNTGYIGYEV